MKTTAILAVATFGFLITARGQNINKFVISAEAAKKTLVRNEISAATAEKITQACVDYAAKNNIAVTVFILSPTGDIVHAHRMDGQVPINIETAELTRISHKESDGRFWGSQETTRPWN